jgi:FtsH-binding integral membrane protein
MSTIGGPAFAKTVRSRIMKTYGYLAGSVVLTGAATFMMFTRGMLPRILAMNPLVFGIGTLLCTFGAIHATMRIPYHENPVLKHAAWASVSGLVGISILSLCAMAGGAIVQQAALITACIVGGMSTAAMVSPNDTFLRMGPYLGVGLGVVIGASLASMFFVQSTLLMNISLYGGLGLFGLFTAHDAQRVLHDAQVAPVFDPISEQMGLYLDSINIFVRIVQILMMQQRRK